MKKQPKIFACFMSNRFVFFQVVRLVWELFFFSFWPFFCLVWTYLSNTRCTNPSTKSSSTNRHCILRNKKIIYGQLTFFVVWSEREISFEITTKITERCYTFIYKEKLAVFVLDTYLITLLETYTSQTEYDDRSDSPSFWFFFLYENRKAANVW